MERGLPAAPGDATERLQQRVSAREALEALSRVPDRRRLVKILSVAGFTYDDIGAMLGLSYTRVNALATEANKWLRTERRLGTNLGTKVRPSEHN
jgi:DNA-directed RNA polymerase specialized sigma24 family protein